MKEEKHLYYEPNKKLKSEERNRRTLELSRGIEECRIRLADSVTKDEFLWKFTIDYAHENNMPGMTPKIFRELPYRVTYNNMRVSGFFANLEKKLLETGGHDLTQNIDEVKGIIDEIYKKRNEMVDINVSLVVATMNGSLPNKINYFADFLHEGLIALIEAAHRFDYKMEYAFSSYASKYIKGYILKAVEKLPMVYISRYGYYRVLNRYNQIKDSVDEDDIKELDRLRNLLNLKRNANSVFSVDNKLSGKDGKPIRLEDRLEDKKARGNDYELVNKDFVEKLESNLSERGKKIISMKAENAILEEISSEIGVSRERIRQIIAKEGRRAIRIINRDLKEKRLKTDYRKLLTDRD